MSKDNALFDDFEEDFDVAVEDEIAGLAADEPANDADEVSVEPDADFGLDAQSPEDAIFGPDPTLTPERPIPAINIMAFCETDSTVAAIDRISGDRRLSRAVVEIERGGLDAATAYLMENPTPNLLILESRAPASELIAQIDKLAEYCDEGVQVMVVGAANDIQLYRQLMTRGVSEYLVPPVQPLGIIQSISNLFTDPDTPFLGRTISVIGAKGGAGASTIAHNLAWSLSQNARMNTTLVDLDLSFGTTALDFNSEAAQTVADALTDPDRTDESVIERLLEKTTERLSLFTAPATLNEVFDVPSEAYELVVETVRRNVPFVVLDLPHMWTDWIEKTLMSSSEVLIVCQPDLASLRNGKNMIDRLKNGRPNDTAPRLVVNMAGVPKRPEIPIKDFAAAIGAEPEIILPFEPHLFGTAANNGQMISETEPNAKASLAIDHLASAFTGKAVQPAEKSIFQKLLGK